VDNLKEKISQFFLELFFPSFCLGCKKEGTYLCQDCKSTLEISEYTYCLCGKNPLRIPPTTNSGKCQRCQPKKLAGLYFALPYKEKALTRKLIHQFKYEPYIKNLANTISDIIIEHLALTGRADKKIWENSVLIPIPMERKKMKERGYNQSEELAKELSKTLSIPIISDTLVKIKKTLPQMTLSAKDRAENLKGAFAIKNPEQIQGKKVFLVDDVYTTGSTMEECANVLRTYEAKQVWGIVLAREE